MEKFDENKDQAAGNSPPPGPEASSPALNNQVFEGSSPPPQEPQQAPVENLNAPDLERILDVPVEVVVELGRAKMLVAEVLDLHPGAIVELSKTAGEPVDVVVGGKIIAKGEVVVVDDNFGIRITDIPKDDREVE